jgi:hypothetical protein
MPTIIDPSTLMHRSHTHNVPQKIRSNSPYRH